MVLAHLGRLPPAPCHVQRILTDPSAPGYCFLAGVGARSHDANGMWTGIPASLPESKACRFIELAVYPDM